MTKNHVITLVNEFGVDEVADFMDALLESSTYDKDSLMHLSFLEVAFEQLSYGELSIMAREHTTLEIIHNGFKRTKSYRLVKPLARSPVYEMRYGITHNEHLRLIFFPFTYKGASYLVFTHVCIKTKIPNVDDTDTKRDLSYNLYLLVKHDPSKYLEVE